MADKAPIARGRARGRSRGAIPPEPRMPGEAPVPTEASQEEQRVGRGRGRAAPPPSEQATLEASAQKLAAMAISPPPQAPPKQAQPQAQPEAGQKGPEPQGKRMRGPASEPHTRPEHMKDKTGTSGQPIALLANYVNMKSRPNCAMYQYNVGYSPIVDSRGLRFLLLRQQEEIVGKVRIFDGMVLYLPKRLAQVTTELVSLHPNDQSKIKLTVTLTNELAPTDPAFLQLLNILFRNVLRKLKMKQINRNYFNPALAIKVPQHRLELWPGFVTSILQYERSVMLGLDISHKILRMDTVYDFLNDLYNEDRSRFREMATKKLVGEIVLTRYNNKTYRVDDIDWSKTPQDTFNTSTGEKISFIEYYKKAYDLTIQDPAQPLLVSQPKARDIRARKGDSSPILLIPELCTRTGLSEEARADFRIMKDLATYTKVDPNDRAATIRNFLGQIKTVPEAQEVLTNWNVEFDKDLIGLNGRVLPPEKILMGNTSFSYRPGEPDWSREMRGASLISAVNHQNYLMVFTSRDADKAQDLFQTLTRVGPPMGMRFDEPQLAELPNDRTQTFLQGIERQLTPETQMVIVVLPTDRKDRYDAIKKFCCVDHPVPSQCVTARVLTKKQGLMSVATKIALQLDCKLGGELWALEIPMKNVMVIGIDAYHDIVTRGRSVCGFIASTNQSLTRYYSQCFLQHTGQELADNLKVAMSKALQKYHQINKVLPDRIIVYRDGVGDGQLAMVVNYEVPQMMDTFKQFSSGGYIPKFSVVVVTKRIITRIFLNQRGQISNPPPGTVVDTEITKPQWYDFFIVSQSVRQGTVAPTHFNVVYDTSGLKPDHMQRLTYKLCHLYYNWQGTVRVPAPCQYAHKLAYLVGESIHREPDEDLADRLYFL
uniref:Piwi n=1 Tax=Ephydatia fluviatilis TaxID=31330 RepID=D5MRY9_9METZ|nr:piwi [Ephydatia fluviatilis]